MIDKRSQIRRMQALVVTKSMENFYGDITIKYENGNIVCAKVVENVKPTDHNSALDIIQEFLSSVKLDDSDKTIVLKKINGKPHLCVTQSGSIEQVVELQMLEAAEGFRYGR